MSEIHATRERRQQAVRTLCHFTVNDTSPFCGSAVDMQQQLLLEAHALSIVVSNAMDDDVHDLEAFLRPHLREAVNAIKTLIALAAFAEEGR